MAKQLPHQTPLLAPCMLRHYLAAHKGRAALTAIVYMVSTLMGAAVPPLGGTTN